MRVSVLPMWIDKKVPCVVLDFLHNSLTADRPKSGKQYSAMSERLFPFG